MFHSTSMMCLMFTMFNKKTLNSRGLHEVSDVSWSFNMLQLLPVDSGQAIFENCLMPQTRRTWKWKGWKMVIDGHRSGRVAPGSMVGQPNMLDTGFICGKPKNDAWIFFTTSSPRGTTESENSGQTIFCFFGWFQNWEPKNCVRKNACNYKNIDILDLGAEFCSRENRLYRVFIRCLVYFPVRRRSSRGLWLLPMTSRSQVDRIWIRRFFGLSQHVWHPLCLVPCGHQYMLPWGYTSYTSMILHEMR